MKTTRLFLGIAAFGVLTLGVVAVGTAGAVPEFGSITPKAVTTPQTTRRIWAIDQTWYSDSLYVWDCNANNGEGNAVAMTRAISGSFWNGLWYADLPVYDGAAQEKIVFRSTTDDWNNSSKSDDVILTGTGAWDYSYGGVFYIWTRDQDKSKVRGVSSSTVSCSGTELGKILGRYSTCSTSYAGGYNAYDVVMRDFVTPSTTRQQDPVDLTAHNVETGYSETNVVSLKTKLDKMQALHTADQNGNPLV